jgi:hypothetical protein
MSPYWLSWKTANLIGPVYWGLHCPLTTVQVGPVIFAVAAFIAVLVIDWFTVVIHLSVFESLKSVFILAKDG